MMNGALLYDIFRTGGIFDPVRFAVSYYSRLPAISMPYHPPLFPLVESLFYAAFGVHYWVARLAIAVALAVCIFLMVRLVETTHGSYWLAFSTVLILFSCGPSQRLAGDVMLEIPALAITLAALYFLRGLASTGELTAIEGISFALAASAAVWTKQNTLFLVAVPWLLVLLNGTWATLRRRTIWVSTAIVLAFSALLASITRSHIDQVSTWENRRWPDIPIHHALFYLQTMLEIWGWPAALLALAIALHIYRRLRGERDAAVNLYIAWAMAAFSLPLLVDAWDPRYLYFCYPPLIVFTLSTWAKISTAIPVALALAFFVLHVNQPPQYLHGLDEAAKAAVGPGVQCIVCFGPNNGSFIAEVRAAGLAVQTTVIRGDKLPAASVNEEFLHRFGISRVVIAKTGAPAALTPFGMVQQRYACATNFPCGRLIQARTARSACTSFSILRRIRRTLFDCEADSVRPAGNLCCRELSLEHHKRHPALGGVCERQADGLHPDLLRD
jgi:hypothetical protein